MKVSVVHKHEDRERCSVFWREYIDDQAVLFTVSVGLETLDLVGGFEDTVPFRWGLGGLEIREVSNFQ